MSAGSLSESLSENFQNMGKPDLGPEAGLAGGGIGVDANVRAGLKAGGGGRIGAGGGRDQMSPVREHAEHGMPSNGIQVYVDEVYRVI